MQHRAGLHRTPALLRVRKNGGLYLLIVPAILLFVCFTYLPMYGVIIAFKDFKPAQGIWGSAWAGLKYFERYFNSYMLATPFSTPWSSASTRSWSPSRCRSFWR
jgi:ABC-type polysaccharide transport system permease subunit